MNIYRCVSEELLYHHHLLDDGTGPVEPYAIAELVAAIYGPAWPDVRQRMTDVLARAEEMTR